MSRTIKVLNVEVSVKTLLIYALAALAALGVEAALAYLWLIGVAPQFEKQLSHH